MIIVDDDRAFLQRMVRAMEQRGFLVRSAFTVSEGIDLVRQMVQMVLDDNAMTVYNHQMMTNIYTSAVKGFSTHPSEYYLLDVNTDIER